jgi:hypothetical protein
MHFHLAKIADAAFWNEIDRGVTGGHCVDMCRQ